MKIDFMRVVRRLNKADSKNAKAVSKVVDAIECLNHSNNELLAINKDCTEMMEKYSKAHVETEDKIENNKTIIDILKNVK
jgi:hypothetical protein